MNFKACLPLAFTLTILSFSPAVFAQEAQATQYLQSGAAAMHEGKLTEAEKYFRQAIAVAPQMAEAYLDLGLALLREGQPVEAAKALRHAVALDSSMQGAHLFLGIAEYQSNHLDDAIAALKQEIALNPQNVEALTWLGIVELAADKPEEATLPLDEAARLSPNDIDVLDYRGRAHSLVANQSYGRMRKIDPDSWHVHRALAQDFSDMGDSANAVKEYQAAIAKQSHNPDLYEALGIEYQKLSHFDLAAQAFEQELKLSPNNAVALYNLGKIDVEHDNAAAGIPLLEKAVPLLQHPAAGYYYLGLGLSKANRDEEAVTWLEKSVASEPSDFIKQGAYFQLARLYQRLHRQQDADRALTALKELKQRGAGQSDIHPQ